MKDILLLATMSFDGQHHLVKTLVMQATLKLPIMCMHQEWQNLALSDKVAKVLSPSWLPYLMGQN